jgi:hypothetical protein
MNRGSRCLHFSALSYVTNFTLAPEGFGNKTVHTLDMAEMEREVLDWMYMSKPRRRPTCYNHLPAQERNAEIARRRRNGESLTSLSQEFGITVQRAWHIGRRGRCEQPSVGPKYS